MTSLNEQNAIEREKQRIIKEVERLITNDGVPFQDIHYNRGVQDALKIIKGK